MQNYLQQINALQMKQYQGQIDAAHREDYQRQIDALYQAQIDAARAEQAKCAKQFVQIAERIIAAVERRSLLRTLKEPPPENNEENCLAV